VDLQSQWIIKASGSSKQYLARKKKPSRLLNQADPSVTMQS
jgi:hypothetical protein